MWMTFEEIFDAFNNGKVRKSSVDSIRNFLNSKYYKSLDIDEKYPGGESPIEFYNRIVNDFEDIVKENKNTGNFMVITHSGVINIIYRYINKMEWSNKIKSIKIANASIYSLRIEKNKREFELENFKRYLESE